MAIEFLADQKLFVLHSAKTTYAMEVNEEGYLVHLYWGALLRRPEDLPVGEMLVNYPHEEKSKRVFYNHEFSTAGGYFFDEPCLKAQFASGARNVVLKYEAHEISRHKDVETLKITLSDRQYGLKVHLLYTLYVGSDLMDRRCVVENSGDADVMLENVKSAVWYVPRGKNYRLSFLSGRWSGEYQMENLWITQSKTVLESRRGIPGPDITQWFALSPKGEATETAGRLWYGALHWAGNWKMVVESDRLEQVRITGGINEFDFGLRLHPGETFETPVFTAGYTDAGFGEASRTLHRYQRSRLLPAAKADKPRKIIYNSWEAFYFDIDEGQQMKLAEKAARVGAEVFVLDDGWFSTRDWCNSGLGDWWPSKTKFPNGLAPLIEKVNSLGMDFGLWVEPEMVNPDSDLYRAHPDWILRFEGRQGTMMRDQFILNLARQDVKEFVLETLTRLLTENNINFLKWDMNRYFTEAGWPEAGRDDDRSVWVKYVQSLYEIYGEVQKRFPDVMVENCCSGGGRVCFGMEAVSDLMSRSDNSDPLDSLKLYWGHSHVFLPKSTGAGSIGVSPNGINGRIAPLRYRIHVAMLTTPYISMNLLDLSEAELEEMRYHMELFKQLRPVIQEGQLYRLVSPWENALMAAMYVSQDRKEAVLFALGQSVQFCPPPERILLQGLDPDAVYAVEGYRDMSGQGLMALGIEVPLKADFDSRIIRLHQIG